MLVFTSMKLILLHPCMFLNPNSFANLNSYCSNLLDLRNKLENHSVTKNCSDLSLFEQIVLVVSKFLQSLSLHTQISKRFSRWVGQFFLTVVQNNIGLSFLRPCYYKDLQNETLFMLLSYSDYNLKLSWFGRKALSRSDIHLYYSDYVIRI